MAPGPMRDDKESRIAKVLNNFRTRPDVFPRPFTGVPVAIVTYTDVPVRIEQMKEIDNKTKTNWFSPFDDNTSRQIVTVENLTQTEGVVVVASLSPKMGGRAEAAIKSIQNGKIETKEAVSQEDVEELAEMIREVLEQEGINVTTQEITLG